MFFFFVRFILSDSPYNPCRYDPVSECKFENNTDTQKVLILPFNNRTDQNNVGDYIFHRLDSIIKHENLIAKIDYCDHFTKTEGLASQQVTQKAKELNANLVIYGDMEKEFDIKKVRLNWITNDNYDYEVYTENVFTGNNSYISYDNSMLKKGELQEGIDYIVYFFAGYIAYQNCNYDKAFYFFKDKIQDELNIETCQVNTMLSYLYLNSVKIDSSQMYLNKSQNTCNFELEVYYRKMYYSFHTALENFDSIKNIDSSLIFDYYENTNDFHGTYNLFSNFLRNNHALFEIRQNEELIKRYRNRFFKHLGNRQKFSVTYSEFANLLNLGKIGSAEEKIKEALEFSIDNELHDLTLKSLQTLWKFYTETNQIIKRSDLEKNYDLAQFQEKCKNCLKKIPNAQALVAQENEILFLIENNEVYINIDSSFLEDKFSSLKYKNHSLNKIYLSVGTKHMIDGRLDKTDSVFALISKNITNNSYKTYFDLLFFQELGNLHLQIAKNLVLSFKKIDQSSLNTALNNFDNVIKICEEKNQKTSWHNINSLRETAAIYALKDNIELTEEYFDNALELIEKSGLKNSYLHSTILFDYANILASKNKQKRKFVEKLYDDCIDIREELLGPNHHKTKTVVEYHSKYLN